MPRCGSRGPNGAAEKSIKDQAVGGALSSGRRTPDPVACVRRFAPGTGLRPLGAGRQGTRPTGPVFGNSGGSLGFQRLGAAPRGRSVPCGCRSCAAGGPRNGRRSPYPGSSREGTCIPPGAGRPGLPGDEPGRGPSAAGPAPRRGRCSPGRGGDGGRHVARGAGVGGGRALSCRRSAARCRAGPDAPVRPRPAMGCSAPAGSLAFEARPASSAVGRMAKWPVGRRASRRYPPPVDAEPT